MSFNNDGHLITSTITTLQHFATLYHTSPNYTSLHLLTLHFLSFALHYSPVWLNPSINIAYRSISSHICRLLSKNMKIKIYRIVILPVVLYGCETWSLIFSEERRLRVYENRVLRIIFGPKREGVTGE